MDKIQLMNVKRQHKQHAELYEQAILETLRSGIYIGGEQVKLFEQEFAAFCNRKYGISCGNGTDALVLVLRALGVGYGDEVITVSFTFFATAESIAAVGATPVFVDVDEKTYCIDASMIEARITEKTKAILPVHIYGQCADMDAVNAIAKKHGLFVIEDCAQAVGSTYKGKPAGSLSDAGCFSFFPTKTLGANGDGGMIVTGNEDIARACKSLKQHGSGEDGLYTLQNEYKRHGEEFPENIPIGKDKYHNYLIGYNSRLDAVQAAVLRKKLPLLPEFVAKRQANAAAYNVAVAGTSYQTPYVSPDCAHSYYIYALRHKSAQAIMDRLHAKGILCGTYYPVPLHLQGAFARLGYKEGDLPITEALCKETFAIPVYPELYIEERDAVISALLEAEYDR
ncbi:MAG TPA: DegT/DnrJ/EryC1/StrS family aminotransferase [Bacillota bacterium]|jgi:dTDP-4-amino-4,6-dideoxygalactose transaminase|nr:DegT/DnrJ/EryC1/StrS family aminotransferase [Bacillota bacterium]